MTKEDLRSIRNSIIGALIPVGIAAILGWFVVTQIQGEQIKQVNESLNEVKSSIKTSIARIRDLEKSVASLETMSNEIKEGSLKGLTATLGKLQESSVKLDTIQTSLNNSFGEYASKVGNFQLSVNKLDKESQISYGKIKDSIHESGAKIGELKTFISALQIAVTTMHENVKLKLAHNETYPSVAVNHEILVLTSIEEKIPESELLNVRIQVFNPGTLPQSEDEALWLSEDIRTAESHYIPVHLKNVMQQIGLWGAIRVVPMASTGAEVQVSGKILKSNGEELKIQVKAIDALGNIWFDREFRGAVEVSTYEESIENQVDAFQNVYYRIANELALHRMALPPEEVHKIRKVAEMRFAEELAPAAFESYLKKDEKSGEVVIDRLPSEENAMLQRIRRVRERDYLLMDILDRHIDGLYRDMGNMYSDWRHSRLIVMNMIREVDKNKDKQRWQGVTLILQGVVVGAASASSSSPRINPSVASPVGAIAGEGFSLMLIAAMITEEAEINKVALEELGVSFATDVKSIVVEVEGKTVELTGTIEAKYQQWRDILRRLFRIEPELE